ncbi:MAG: hypothetical protein KC636_17505, partial [Myxococcales bacterium]|nr:hypothetical protein [Myxococcales bacterium]
EAELRTLEGDLLESFALQGTTPTITRVYRAGKGTHHDNILRDSPTWPVALALSDDADLVAIGGSDSKVRLFDRRGGGVKELAYDWIYEERRHMGANPDRNIPLDMRFVDDGAALLVVYSRGDVIRWSVASGKQRGRVPGTCDVAEATKVVNRYNPPDQPTQAPTAEQREACGRAKTARLSPDARWVVTAGDGLRVRDAHTGAPRAMIVRGDGTIIPDDMLEISRAGTLALVNIYGRPELWSGGDALRPMFGEPLHTGPIDPTISSDGRWLSFDLGREQVVWDMYAGRRLDLGIRPDEQLVALSPDGALVVVRTLAGGELRRVATGAVAARWPDTDGELAANFSARGTHVIIDIGWRDRRRVLVRALESGHERTLALPPESATPILSGRGEAIVARAYKSALFVVDPSSGQLRQRIDAPGVDAVALADDGSFVVWMAGDDDRPEGVVHYQSLRTGDGGDARTIAVQGWPKREGLAISPDGREVLIGTEQSLTRWRPHEDVVEAFTGWGYFAENRLAYAATGDGLLLTRYDRVDVHHNDRGLTRVGSLYPLTTGGWLAMSEAGAVDGSDDALAHAVTMVVGPRDRWVDGGALAWDRLRVPGLYAALRAGRDEPPPIQALPAEAIRQTE